MQSRIVAMCVSKRIENYENFLFVEGINSGTQLYHPVLLAILMEGKIDGKNNDGRKRIK